MSDDITARMQDLLDDVRHDNYDTEQAAVDALTAIADQYAAAELRRLASEATEEIDGWIRDALRRSANGGPDSPAYRDMDKVDARCRYHRDRLLRRADELDGGVA